MITLSRLYIESLHPYNFYICTDENLEISSSTGTNRFRVSSDLYGVDQLKREVVLTHTSRKNSQTQKLDLKI